MDAEMHAWLSKRKRRGEAPKARSYLTKFRRSHLTAVFHSLDCDGSGAIDGDELKFALTHLGLNSAHAATLLAQGDIDQDTELDLDKWIKLVESGRAREAHRTERAATRRLTREGDAARSLCSVVDRASAFPIGVLANAQYIRQTVAQYDPDRSDEPAVEAVAVDPRTAPPRAPQREPASDGLGRGGGKSGAQTARAVSQRTSSHARWLRRGASSNTAAFDEHQQCAASHRDRPASARSALALRPTGAATARPRHPASARPHGTLPKVAQSGNRERSSSEGRVRVAV